MTQSSVPAQDLNDLKSYVYQTLCEHEELEVGVFPMTEKLLTRRRQPCGMYFCLHGPRSVKFTAIWESDSNKVFFYRSDGERFLIIQVSPSAKFELSQ